MVTLNLCAGTPMIEKPQKPKSQNADLANLPPALAPLCRQPHWVLWRWERRREKWTKPPYMPTGANAKSDDPSTWSDYPTTLDAAGRANGSIDGIGFMLRETDFTTIDPDHCLDLKGRPDSWAAAWLETLGGAYVERTPSGQGLRIIGIGAGERLQRRWTIKDAPRPDAAVEIYRNCERYITVTGAQIGGGAELQPIDAGKIVAHYDAAKEAAKGAVKASNGSKAGNGSKNKTGAFDFNEAGSQSGSIDYDEVIRNGAPNGQRSELFQACVWHLAAKGLSVEEIVAELAQHPRGIGEKYAGRLKEEVERSFVKWQAQRQPTPAADAEEPEEAKGWKETDKRGRPRPTCTNTRRALRVLDIKCRYDVFHDKLLVESPIIRRRDNLDQTVQILRTKIEKAYGFDPGTKNTHDALIQLCLENEFDYLNALNWDDTPRLGRWLVTYAGADDTELNREFGRIALVAAVRRVRSPGVKFDPIIVLEGPMGTNKSKAIETLAGIENFSDQSIFGVRDREQQELLAGVWLYEIAELSNIRKTEVEHIKAFASRTHDRARPAYGRTRVDQPRRCVLFATTNNDRYLKEADRRFWPVKTTDIDVEALKRDRDQLWAEAAQQEREGASITLRLELREMARTEQQAREEADPWDDILAEAVGEIEQGEERIFSRDLLAIVLGIHQSKLLNRDTTRLAKCMQRLGWKKVDAMRIGEKRTSGYCRPVKGDEV
jgi:Virulence-associated protein E